MLLENNEKFSGFSVSSIIFLLELRVSVSMVF